MVFFDPERERRTGLQIVVWRFRSDSRPVMARVTGAST
jgi:hypothetical protein